MNKGELIEAVQKTLGGDTSKKASEEAVKAVLESIAKGVKKDGSVQLLGFGTLRFASVPRVAVATPRLEKPSRSKRPRRLASSLPPR